MSSNHAVLVDDAPPMASRPSTPPPGAIARSTPLWSPWHCRNWPATPSEEAAFALDLTMRSGDVAAAPQRSDVTAVLNALRGGLTLGQLLAVAPGLRVERLNGAYTELERRRRLAEDAWQTIVRIGSTSALRQHGDVAAQLVPTLVEHLRAVVESDPRDYADACRRLVQRIATIQGEVGRIEAVLDTCEPPSARGVQLGAHLLGPDGSGLAGRPDFLPERIGLLEPTRVAALLGERDQPTG